MKPLRFLHIPKTAGSTLSYILNRIYKNEKCFSFTGDADLDTKRFYTLSEYDRENVGLFVGHAPIITGISQADNATTITFLRDPVERVKSFCQHVSEGKSPYLIHQFPPDNFNLDKLLNSGILELSNFQAMTLVNQRNKDAPVSINNMSVIEAEEVAIDNLFNKIECYGLQEYFDESLIYLSLSLGWKMPFYISKNKKNNSKLIEFKEHHIKRIEELNNIDIEVYKLARKQFTDKMDSVDFDKNRLKKFQFYNSFAGNSSIPILERIIK